MTSPIVYAFHSQSFPATEQLSRIEGLEAHVIHVPGDLDPYARTGTPGIVLIDAVLAEVGEPDGWGLHYPGILISITEEDAGDGDFLVPRGWPRSFTLNMLRAAVREIGLRQGEHSVRGELAQERDKSNQLTHIGIALSAQTDINQLLTMILSEGRKFACCDAASLFLIDHETNGSPEMVFKLTQNDSISFPFEEKRMPLDTSSISGFVAVSGESLNIEDVYELEADSQVIFNRSFDEAMSYRTRSMLTIPMKNHRQEVIGVLQFLNRKKQRETVLDSTETTLRETLPFGKRLQYLLEGLASQAAVAIENSLLISRINNLFEGFVKAAVHAIEQRDPTTSGHSFRVADFTTNLARALPRSSSRYREARFSDDELREIRYASLLHDFGKVGVREPVLVKANKLPERGLDVIRQRFSIYKEQLRRGDLERRLDFVMRHGARAYEENRPRMDEEIEAELKRFSDFCEDIVQANTPTILPEGRFNHLEQIRDLPAFEVEGEHIRLLTEREFMALSVRKGSLTPEERREIESHVTHTFNFLELIPWTPGLKKVPSIAHAHHEKLDGSGYPLGLNAESIPLPSKMMTIADIYDALTASDRPYKRAVPLERALGILEAEAKSGFLDSDLVEVFIEARIHETSDWVDGYQWRYEGFDDNFFHRNVCDYDLEPS